MGPASRNAVMAKFRAPHKGKKVLVVLGSLSRSLVNEGMSQVSLVVNYDLPRQIEDYLHRSVRGRRRAAESWAETWLISELHLSLSALTE